MSRELTVLLGGRVAGRLSQGRGGPTPEQIVEPRRRPVGPPVAAVEEHVGACRRGLAER